MIWVVSFWLIVILGSVGLSLCVHRIFRLTRRAYYRRMMAPQIAAEKTALRQGLNNRRTLLTTAAITRETNYLRRPYIAFNPARGRELWNWFMKEGAVYVDVDLRVLQFLIVTSFSEAQLTDHIERVNGNPYCVVDKTKHQGIINRSLAIRRALDYGTRLPRNRRLEDYVR